MAIKTMHVITEIYKLSTYISALIFVWLFNDEYIVDPITKHIDLMIDLSLSNHTNIKAEM